MSGERDNFDPLDELLAAARWPEMSAEATGRLRWEWEAGARRRRSVAWWGRAAAAAVIVGLVGVWVSRLDRREVGPGAVVVEHRGEVRAEPRVAWVPSREANAAELAVALTAASRVERRAAGGMREAPVARGPETLEGLLRRDARVGVERCLRMVREGRDGEAVAALKAVRGEAVERLFARLDDPRVDVRLAAARLLGRVDGPAVTERLAEMVGENRNRREALAALMQSDGAEARRFILRAEESQDLEAVVRSVAVQIKAF